MRAGGTAVATRPPPALRSAPPQPQARAAAIPLPQRDEPLVSQGPATADELTPLPRNMSLVDPRMPMMRKLRLWFFSRAERWVERRKPLPEQPTLAQLEKLRKELASVQRKLDKMLG